MAAVPPRATTASQKGLVFRIPKPSTDLLPISGTTELRKGPFAQGVHESAGFTSSRWVQSFNPAGLGATNDGAWGQTFQSPAEGITAQIAHLLAYAVPLGEGNVPQNLLIPFDPRLVPVIMKGWRGNCPRWIDLNGRWAWPGDQYAQGICRVAGEILRSAM